jgi:NAD(P)-dependent dehydrogenase (short-subunit alcohol dehydrogenase family)
MSSPLSFGEIAVATGGGSRIGRATAQRLAAEGTAVAVAEIDLAPPAMVAENITVAGGTAIAVAPDGRELETWQEMVAVIRGESGALPVALFIRVVAGTLRCRTRSSKASTAVLV